MQIKIKLERECKMQLLNQDESVTILNIKLCEIKLHETMKAKLRFHGMRECTQEIEVLHKAPKKPVRKPAA